MTAKALTIMVVDDEPDLLAIIAKILEREGYKTHTFSNPEKALEHIELDRCADCSIIVSDIRMPLITGIQLAKRAKKLRPEIKIILMSAFEIYQNEWQKALPSTDVDGFIQKPFNNSHLVEAIAKCVDGDGRSK